MQVLRNPSALQLLGDDELFKQRLTVRLLFFNLPAKLLQVFRHVIEGRGEPAYFIVPENAGPR